ncbi:CxC2 domain-containing protein [Mycena venus]|uniref:CxC2 domain-containing protein n=1 Tax=Mycena venus TaxID=2733690 RepID=A0A8H6YJ84_9AGAR|nr:CxC2 domain-containing protein [Mycena venus]
MSRHKLLAAHSNTHHHVFSLADIAPPEDEVITGYVGQMSADGRRVYRSEVIVQPPSPVKKQWIDAMAAPVSPDSPDDSLQATSELLYERYDVGAGVDDYDCDNSDHLSSPRKTKGPAIVTPAMRQVSVRLARLIWSGALDALMLHRVLYQSIAVANVMAACYTARNASLQDIGNIHCIEFIADVAQVWEDGHYTKTSLADLGLCIQLGHLPIGHFSHCTAPEPSKEGFVCLHTNGIHKVKLNFCGCERANAAGPYEVQLLRAGWFPATHEVPHTAATYEVVQQFHLETLQAKTTMYDFYHILERLSDNTSVKPPDRYHEWIRMCRQYQHLMMLKRAGRLTAYDSSGTAGTKSRELAIECPACPRPGINLPEGWENTPPEKRHLYTFFLALDACFCLKRRLVSNELRDPGLGSGLAYMTENKEYREYLLTCMNQKEMSTCSGFAALDYANTKFSRGYATTGVGMGVCTRHEFVQPNGIGDLQWGEQFSNMDYIFGLILRHKHTKLWKQITYDIICIWSKYLKDRMEALPALVRLVLIQALYSFAIPKMHIHAHTLLCQLIYSLNWMIGSGQLDAKAIEHAWAAISAVATSTRNMGPGARHSVLDCQWSFWNWVKLLGIFTTLWRQIDNARVELADQQAAFEEFSREQGKRVAQWKQKVDDFKADPTKPNPYKIVVSKQGVHKVHPLGGDHRRLTPPALHIALYGAHLSPPHILVTFQLYYPLEAERCCSSDHISSNSDTAVIITACNCFQMDPTDADAIGLSEAQVCLQFTQEEAKQAALGVPAIHDISPSKFISLGLDLEEEQRRIRVAAVLKKANTTEMQIDLGSMRTKLNWRVTQFRKLQLTYTPAALKCLGDADIPEDQQIKNIPLLLPLAIPPALRAVGCLTGLTDVEALMRHAQCWAALASLRNQLHIKTRLLVYKKGQSQHQGANTRSRTIITRNESKIDLHSEKYQMAWEAIRLLSDDGDPAKVLWHVLKKEDIRCMEDTEDVEKKRKQREAHKARVQKRHEELRRAGLLGTDDAMDVDVETSDDDNGPIPENRRQISWI